MFVSLLPTARPPTLGPILASGSTPCSAPRSLHPCTFILCCAYPLKLYTRPVTTLRLFLLPPGSRVFILLISAGAYTLDTNVVPSLSLSFPLACCVRATPLCRVLLDFHPLSRSSSRGRQLSHRRRLFQVIFLTTVTLVLFSATGSLLCFSFRQN